MRGGFEMKNKTDDEICVCGYKRYEHRGQMLLAEDRINHKKYGAPCGIFKPKKELKNE